MQKTAFRIRISTNVAFIMLITALTILIPIQLLANDSTARIDAGGITFLKEENIRMLQEHLEISRKKIKVRYRFLNESDQDIQATVAFPLPDYLWDPELVEFKEITAHKKFANFRNWINGKPVTVKRLQKALIGTTDVTDKLRKIGLTDKQIFETFGDTTTDGTKLTKKQQNQISDLFLIITHKKSDNPDWRVSETIYWEQIFPKGKEIEVSSEYTPYSGQVLNYLNGDYKQKLSPNPIPNAVNYSNFKHNEKNSKEACIDEGTVRAVQRKVKNILSKSPESSIAVVLNDVEYILGTGRNWKGPIGNFTLRIHKETPDQLVSLCFPGKPKQINPTTIEFSQSDYTPIDRLIVYFISVYKND